MKKLTVMDKGFLLSESRETPMHVGGVGLYTLPEGADTEEFLGELARNLANTPEFMPPFGDRLKSGRLGVVGPTFWEPDPALDLDYHIRHSALPKPGRYRELFTLVSRLHATLLERSRPLWEMHLIEGLQNRQFAFYTKAHHAAVDGARSMHIAKCMLSPYPEKRLNDSPLSLRNWEAYRSKVKRRPPPLSDRQLFNVVEALKSTFDSGNELYGAAKRITRAWTGKDNLLLPFLRVPSSSINTSVDGARRFVAQTWPFARFKAIANAYDGTFNDAVLAMCGGALRRYLQLHSELPDESLKAMVPVSVRSEGDVDSSNSVAAINADLGTNISDPTERFTAISASMRAGKALFADLSSQEAQWLTMLLSTPGALIMPLGLVSRIPPFNTVISNVVGHSETMYWNGARLDGQYPASIIMDGVAMNITLSTYADNVDFGIIACRRSMPQVQRIIDYMEDALVELEDAAGIAWTSGEKPKKARAKTKSKPKAKAKTRAKPKVKKAVKAKSASKTRRAAESGNEKAESGDQKAESGSETAGSNQEATDSGNQTPSSANATVESANDSVGEIEKI